MPGQSSPTKGVDDMDVEADHTNEYNNSLVFGSDTSKIQETQNLGRIHANGVSNVIDGLQDKENRVQETQVDYGVDERDRVPFIERFQEEFDETDTNIIDRSSPTRTPTREDTKERVLGEREMMDDTQVVTGKAYQPFSGAMDALGGMGDTQVVRGDINGDTQVVGTRDIRFGVNDTQVVGGTTQAGRDTQVVNQNGIGDTQVISKIGINEQTDLDHTIENGDTTIGNKTIEDQMDKTVDTIDKTVEDFSSPLSRVDSLKFKHLDDTKSGIEEKEYNLLNFTRPEIDESDISNKTGPITDIFTSPNVIKSMVEIPGTVEKVPETQVFQTQEEDMVIDNEDAYKRLEVVETDEEEGNGLYDDSILTHKHKMNVLHANSSPTKDVAQVVGSPPPSIFEAGPLRESEEDNEDEDIVVGRKRQKIVIESQTESQPERSEKSQPETSQPEKSQAESSERQDFDRQDIVHVSSSERQDLEDPSSSNSNLIKPTQSSQLNLKPTQSSQSTLIKPTPPSQSKASPSSQQNSQSSQLNEETSAILDEADVVSRKSVWAIHQFKLYPGKVISVGKTTSEILFEEGSFDIDNTNLFPLDLRIGDTVHIKNDRTGYEVVGMRRDPQTDTETQTSTETSTETVIGRPESEICCVRGYYAVCLQRKAVVKTRKESKVTVVALSNIYMEIDDWYQHQQQFSVKFDPSVLSDDILTSMMQENMRTPTRKRHYDIQSKPSPISKTVRELIDERPQKGVFNRSLFCMTSVDEETKKELARVINSHGGVLLYDGFIDIFEYRKGRQLRLKLRDDFIEEFDFVALIANGVSRSSKYLQTLALGWPIISERFIIDVSKGVSEFDSWPAYLLTAGKSTVIKGIKSLDIHKFQHHYINQKTIDYQINLNGKLLNHYVIVMVGNPGNYEERCTLEFIIHAFGAKGLTIMNTEVELMKWIDGRRGKEQVLVYCKGLRLEGYRVIDWEWVVQCCISSHIWG